MRGVQGGHNESPEHTFGCKIIIMSSHCIRLRRAEVASSLTSVCLKRAAKAVSPVLFGSWPHMPLSYFLAVDSRE
ncbi:hypothetical protein QQF64_032755 [Cirrhinus molitorella]|uniref:Uncharacterized protein n=1 Tax=Cirrhinus molitorella TaxID=172907 RepID=A0ABR3MRX4_9TELE